MLEILQRKKTKLVLTENYCYEINSMLNHIFELR